MKLDSTQKVTTQSGIEQENALLNESAAMESSLTLQIMELEGETKQVRFCIFCTWLNIIMELPS